MDYSERVDHARGVYPTQYIPRMGTARVKQEEETDTRTMQESSKTSGRKEREHKGETSKQYLTSSDWTINWNRESIVQASALAS